MRSPGPLLCDVSGGLDSSTVCSVAARIMHGNSDGCRLIGWSTANRASNDLHYQEMVAQQCGIGLRTLDIAAHRPFQALRDSPLPAGGIVQCEAADSAMRGYAASWGARSRLTGHGADALMQKSPSSPVYLSEWFRAGQILKWVRELKVYVDAGTFSLWHLLTDCTRGTLDLHAGRFKKPFPSWLRPEFEKEVREAHGHFLSEHTRLAWNDARERLLRMTLFFLPYNGRMLPDERMPLVHRPLVEFVLSLSWEHLVRPGTDRLLVRRALQDVLPAAVMSGSADSRHGASLTEGFRLAWRRLAPLLTGERLADLGVVERKGFCEAMEALRAGYEGPNPQLTKTALYLEIWLAMKAQPEWAEAWQLSTEAALQGKQLGGEADRD